MGVYKTKNATKDGRSYYFRVTYKDLFGNRRDYSSQKFKTKREAMQEEAKYRSSFKNFVLRSSTITIKDAFLDYEDKLRSSVKKQTLQLDSYVFNNLTPIENVRVNSISVETIKELKAYLDKKGYSIRYKNTILKLLKRIIKHSSMYYLTSDSILKFITTYKSVNEIKKELNFYTIDEFKQFIINVDKPEWKCFFEILFYLGLRCGEAQALTWNDIDFDKECVNINKTLTSKIKGERWTISTPKTKNSTRILPIPKKVLNSLKICFSEAKKYKNFSTEWFVFGNSVPFKETTIRVKKNMYCKLANLKPIRIHDFRHSCASMLINQNASIVLVSKWLGHANISTTLNIYSHLYTSELEIIKERINNI